MLQSLYRRVLALAASRHAPWWLAAVAFAEASFFPVPPDALLVPMALAKPERAWRLALLCTVASVAGGMLGYYIGYALFNELARPLLEAYGYGPAFARFKATFAEWGVWIILLKGISPIPYKIVTIASGAAEFNFLLFMLASLITRGGRFFLLATLLHFYGDSVRAFIDRQLTLVLLLLLAGVVLGFVILKYL